ncbi:MAG: L-rhamnose mutarotase [Prevotellaceae bacterium]|jgi:L-rhamnose mutarotase|nr:L-rhamnose mutarotase [Prevotellaceae bacterium]
MEGLDLKDGYREAPTAAVKRYCRFLKLNPDTLQQYVYWHRSENIWKEIPAGIRRAGVLSMEIYVMGIYACMIMETALDFDWDESFGRLATYERQAEWEDFVARFQQTEAGRRTEEKWQLMERIFSLNESIES